MPKTLSAFTMSITPFDARSRIDEAAFRKHLRRLRAAGVGVYIAGSGSGEAITFSAEERDLVLAIAVDELKGHVSVRAMGCEPHLIEDMLEYVAAAERAQVDAVHIYSLDIGHGTKPTRREMDYYYSTVLGATALPVILSSHRAAGYAPPLDLIAKLTERFPNVVGFAYGGSNIDYLAEAIKHLGNRIEVHCSGLKQALTTLGLGGNGFMGHEGNLTPKLTMSVISAFRDGNPAALRVSFAQLMALNAIGDRHGGSSVRALKPIMNAYGMGAGSLRLPRIAITPEELTTALADVARIGVPELPALSSGA